MYKLKRVKKYNIMGLLKVAGILNKCGKDMVEKYDLHHWDNSYLKSVAIVIFCSLKNRVYLLYDKKLEVGTFMIKIGDNYVHFEKLATLPEKHNKGIGSVCIENIEKIAREENCNSVKMEVYEPSQQAVSFYLKKGYSVVGELKTKKYKEIIMEKSI